LLSQGHCSCTPPIGDETFPCPVDAGSKPGKPKEHGFLKPEEVAEALLCLLKLPPDVRIEELMLRSTYQRPEF